MVKKKDVETACASALRSLGFVGRSGILFRRVNSDASGWVGLNAASQGLPQVMEVNPVIGVYFERFGELSRALMDDIPRQPAPLISMPIGYLMPEKTFRTWRFVEGADIDQGAQSLSSAVAEHGLPFIERYADWNTLSQEVEASQLLKAHQRAKVLPIILAMNGEVSRALEIINGELARLAGAETVYAISYRNFVEKFLVRFVSERP
ncbi:hypothetical protein ACQPW3_11410 [Actinosynnema sp. CA-248983]